MRKARLGFLLVAAVLATAAGVRGEVFVTTVGSLLTPSLVFLDSAGSSPIFTAISGLQPSEFPVGVAIRPSTGELYLVGSSGRLYRMSSTGGMATPVGPPFTLSGIYFGVAFDNADRIRVVSDNGQNFRLDPTTGAVTMDAPLAFAADDPNAGKTPQIGAIAYDHAHGSATAYALDFHFGLVRLGSASASDGLLTSIAPGPGSLVGFDISPATGVAYGLAPGFKPFLLTVNLTTGATSLVAQVGNQFTFFRGLAVRSSAVSSIPTLSWRGLVCLALGLASSALFLRRRRTWT